jgi:serine/threonine protein kinase
MAALSHPHIVAVLDTGWSAGWPYVILEYVAGPTLRALLKPGYPWPLAAAAPLLDAIARALTYIHAQGILHLDLKPENVLLSPRFQAHHPEFNVSGAAEGSGLWTLDVEFWTPKLADFGLAKPFGAAAHVTALSRVRGSLDYCAPEQCHGLPVDPRTDLFALATLTYELLTGGLPGRVYRPVAERHPHLDVTVDDVLRRGLARDAEERLPSVETYRHQLALAFTHRMIPEE